MLPTKKLQTQNVALSNKIDLYSHLDDIDDDGEMSIPESSNDDNSPRKQRKRRTLSETSKRDFVCGCGKSYVSYPAIYLHVQRKHNGDWPTNTLIPEKSDNQDKVKRGRPKKEKHNMLDVNNDIQNEVKYKAEDNFWLFIGTKGSTGNPKLENKFITNLETQPYNAQTLFQYADLFEDLEIHKEMSHILKVISSSTNLKNINKKEIEGASAHEIHLSHFIQWISNPLKEEIFIELGIIVNFLRLVATLCIWNEGRKSAISLKEDSFEVIGEGESSLVNMKLTKNEHIKLESFLKVSVCPLLGCKWGEIRRGQKENILLKIVDEAKKMKDFEEMFYKKLQAFSTCDNVKLDCLAEAMLNLKDTELKENVKAKRKYHFLNQNSKEDLKELIQKLCEWVQFFDEKELQLQDTGLNQ